MSTLYVFLVSTLVARLIGLVGVNFVDSWHISVAVGLAAMFLQTGSSHFIQPRRGRMILMVPPSLPFRRKLVDLTGILEFLGAAGLIVHDTRVAASWCLLALLVLVFPANVRAVREVKKDPAMIVSMPLWARSLMQCLLVVACAFVAITS